MSGRGEALTFGEKKYILRMDKSGSMPKIPKAFERETNTLIVRLIRGNDRRAFCKTFSR